MARLSSNKRAANALPQTVVEVGSMEMRRKRAKNPGGPDMPHAKRTSDEVAQQKQVVADQKASAAAKYTSGVEKLAQIEARTLEKQRESSKTAAHPPTAKMQKQLRRRPEQPAREPSMELDDARDRYVDFSDDGHGSSDEYQDNDIDIESEDDMADESEPEPAKRAPAKKGKGSLRQSVEVARAQLPAPKTSVKRKAPAVEFPHKQSKKPRATQPHGLRRGWADRSSSTAVGLGFGADVTFGDDDDDRDNFGGPLSEDEDDGGEREAAAKHAGKAKQAIAKLPLLAGIVATAEPTYVEPKATAAASTKAKVKAPPALKKDLTPAQRHFFDNEYAPTILTFVAQEHAWSTPDDSTFTALYNSVVPEEHQVAHDSDAGRVLVKLSKKALSAYTHEISSVALKAVDSLVAKKTKEEIVQFVQEQLGGKNGPGSGKDTNRRYYWRVWDEDKPQGFLSGPLIVRVVAYLISKTSSDDGPGPIGFNYKDSGTWPVGYVTLAMQAIKRALNCYSTGEPIVITTSAGAFSKTNYGDRPFNVVDGVNVPLFGTSNIVRLLREGTQRPEQWRKLISAAREAASKPEEKAPVVFDVDAMMAATTDEDFDIADYDSYTESDDESVANGPATVEPELGCGASVEC
ncbi:hypothetical protein C8F01DRAFT_1094370 [Mycena amicta]|nr:hypothetical protein C8F01DRAFT_1094370 [Mycena amicta]